MLGNDHTGIPPTVARMGGHHRIARVQHDPGQVDAGRQQQPDQVGGHRVLVGGDGDQAFPRDLDRIAKAVVGGDRRQRAERRLLRREPLDRGTLRGIRGTRFIDPLEPLDACLGKVGIIMERAPEQEVLLDELDQILDGSLLVARCRRTGIGEKAELGGACHEGRVPDGLIGGITPDDDGLHVVGRHHPRHPVQGDKDGNQAAQQGLLTHLRGEAHGHPAAVLQAGRKEGADLAAQVRAGERKLAHLPPINLQQLARKPVKAHRNLAGEAAFACAFERAHIVVKGGRAAGIGVVGMLAGLLDHALHGPLLIEPRFDGGGEDGDHTGALAGGHLRHDGLTQHPSNGLTMVARQGGDLGGTPPLLVEIVDSRTIHEIEHPCPRPSIRSPIPASDGS